MKIRLLGCTGDVVEVGAWLWKIMRYLPQSRDSPGHCAVHNVHKTSHSEGNVWSAKIGQAVKHINFNTENNFNRATCGWCVRGWLLTRTGHLRWGHTVHYLPNPSSGRQLWRHCECCIMKWTNLRQRPEPHVAFLAAWWRKLRTCSRWRWLPPSSASLLCPLVNSSRSSPARWDWASSSTWADAESSWRRHGETERHTKYGTAEKEGQAAER